MPVKGMHISSRGCPCVNPIVVGPCLACLTWACRRANHFPSVLIGERSDCLFRLQKDTGVGGANVEGEVGLQRSVPRLAGAVLQVVAAVGPIVAGHLVGILQVNEKA